MCLNPASANAPACLAAGAGTPVGILTLTPPFTHITAAAVVSTHLHSNCVRSGRALQPLWFATVVKIDARQPLAACWVYESSLSAVREAVPHVALDHLEACGWVMENKTG